jgi:ElaA protein
MLAEPDGGVRIGRVCVAAPGRGRGVAGRLMAAALDRLDGRPCVLDAQAHLVDFYGAFGFAPTGPGYVEDGIPHVPMAKAENRPAPRSSGGGR